MSDITRYDPDTVGSYGMFSAVMREEPEGDYVKYEDVVSIMASQSRELSEARKSIKGLKSMVASLQETGEVIVSEIKKETEAFSICAKNGWYTCN